MVAGINYVKEEYIGYVFSLCSNYITKLEEYRKNIGRKLKAGRDDIKSLVSGNTIMYRAERVYHSFDAIFFMYIRIFVRLQFLRDEELS